MTKKIVVYLIILFFIISCRTFGVNHHEDEMKGGMDSTIVIVNAQPTEAAIYLNGKKIGLSPLSLEIWNSIETSFNLTAVPLHENQYRQELMFQKGEMPRRVTFFMDKNPFVVSDFKLDEKKIIEVMGETVQSEEKMVLDELSKCDASIPPRLFFEMDKSNLAKSEKEKLDRFATKISSCSSIMIELHGYADDTGSHEYNKKLSLKRSIEVEKYLVSKELPKDIIIVFGHGEINTYTDQGLKMDRAWNRIVDIVIKKIIKHEKN